MDKTWVIISFRNTTDAIRMETTAKQASMPGRIIPLPQQISAGCGLAWRAPIEEKAALLRFIENNEINYEGITEM